MWSRFLRDEQGQTTVEYLLILAVLVVGIAVMAKGMQDKLPQVMDEVFGGVNAKIRQLFKAAGT